MPVVQRRAPRGPEMLRRRAPGDRAQRDAGIGRPEGRGAALLQRDAAQLCHRSQRVDVRGLPLIGAHAERGVALQMLGPSDSPRHGRFLMSLAVTSFWKSTNALPRALGGIQTGIT